MTALPEKLKKKIEEEANKYRDEDFKLNPNGYHIAPYCNSETTSDAFECGARAMFELLMPEIESLVEAMDDCAWATSHEEVCARRPFGKEENCDCHISIARDALTRWRSFVGSSSSSEGEG